MEPTQFKGKGVVKWALSIGIIIVLNLFFAAAIQVAYPMPEYQAFCPQSQVHEPIVSEEACVAMGGQWNANIPTKADESTGYCYEEYTCSQEYQQAREGYERNVFGILILLGALAIGAGFILRISPAVSAGLSYGGVLSFIIASIRYWSEAGDLVRLAIVGAALLALIVIGVKKFKE